MKRKLTILSIGIVFFLFSGNVFGQGIFSDSKTPYSDEEQASDAPLDDNNAGIFTFASPPPKPGGPGPDEDPIGEGVGILSLLAGGYALIRKNKTRKRK
ncbi:MAG: hypothetical protein LBH12_03880 [Dysgonamonadaceae bacterium]|jgi:hypothetical protein|nr:hypothetical protein [Dysgonamonadaceae bacterium]